MKRMLSLCAAALCLTMALAPTALAADFETAPPNAKVCYPTSIVRSDDGTELKKIYDLGPEDDPAGIPRSDFQKDGFQYTLTDLLKQELPENESRQHTETVTLQSKKKDMESVLALLPQEKEFITDDGLIGNLTLRLDTVQVEPAGYGSSTKEVSAKRSYPNLTDQDTQYIPKTIEENGRTLTLQEIQWQTDNTATTDGYALGDRHRYLHRQRHQQLCHRLHGHGRIHRYSQPHCPEPCALCCHLRRHLHPAHAACGNRCGHPCLPLVLCTDSPGCCRCGRCEHRRSAAFEAQKRKR